MRLRIGAIFFSIFCLLSSALAQDLILYPKKGQSQQKMEKDKFECYTWAKNQSGFDPMVPPKATTPPPVQEKTKASPLRGAAGGALVGLAAGSLASEAGKGAAIGAASGALIGGVRRQKHQAKQEQSQQQWADEQAAIIQQNRTTYNRAYSACMEARDYTVK
jgi:hypothetical protein